MFSWRRKLPRSSMVAFIVAGACAAAAFWAADSAGSSPDLGAPTSVVVVAGDISPGETFAAEDLQVTTLPASVVPPGALTDPGQAAGRTAITGFTTGEVVTVGRLAPAGGPLTVAVPPGLVAIAVSPDTAPAGIRQGDRVDVVATFLTTRPYAATVGEDLTVLQVGEAGLGGAATPPLTLITDPFTAAELAKADATATLAIAVRGFEPLP